jgi:CDP-2,3-bis-(O-geranylgeranyl)-sn-glycerol synthase
MVLGVILLLLPAAAANMAPVIVSRFPFLDYPLDGGMHVCGKRLLGGNKTVRGLVCGTIAGILVAWLQTTYAAALAPFALVDYAALNPILFGGLAGFGALFGDAVKSAVKRQLDIAPGSSWIPFDQLDWIAGMFLFLLPLSSFSLPIYILAFVIGGTLHPLVNIAGYVLGLKHSVI